MPALTARWIIPVTSDPIPNGLLHIEDDRIVAVEQGRAGQGTRDLGNVAILPGLVNAHTHLELSAIKTPLGHPGISIVDWISQLVATRQTEEYAPTEAVRRGLQESAAAGVVAVGDIVQGAFAATDTSIATTSFLELIGPTEERAAEALKKATDYVGAGQGRGAYHQGLSPHAPYSLRPEVLEGACHLSKQHQVPVAFHLAESREEMMLLQEGAGPFRELLERFNSWDPEVQHAGRRPLDFLQTLAAADRSLVIHGNYLDEEEIGFIADQHDRMSVVYCPRTHQWFQHDPYPLQTMLAAGVNVAFGTDSRASSPDLNLLQEMRTVAEYHPDVPPEKIVEMGTMAGAKSLGHESDLGSLQPGKLARFTVVQLPDNEHDHPYAWLRKS